MDTSPRDIAQRLINDQDDEDFDPQDVTPAEVRDWVVLEFNLEPNDDLPVNPASVVTELQKL